MLLLLSLLLLLFDNDMQIRLNNDDLVKQNKNIIIHNRIMFYNRLIHVQNL